MKAIDFVALTMESSKQKQTIRRIRRRKDEQMEGDSEKKQPIRAMEK